MHAVISPEERIGELNVQIHKNVIALAPELRVALHVHFDVEVAGEAFGHRFPFPREPYHLAILYAGRYGNGDLLRLLEHPVTATIHTGVNGNLPRTIQSEHSRTELKEPRK